MTELDIEQLKRWDKILATSGIIAEAQAEEALGRLLEELPAIIADLEDRDRLRAAGRDILDRYECDFPNEEAETDCGDCSYCRFRAALERRDG